MRNIALYIISDGIGGAEQVVWQMLYGLRIYDNSYIITNNEMAAYYANLLPNSKMLNIGNVYIHRNKKFKLIRYLLNNRFYSIKKWIIKSKTNLIIHFLKENGINIIHCHLDYALFSSLNLKRIHKNIRIIYSVHSAFGFLENDKYRPDISLKQMDFSNVDYLIFVSKYLYDVYKKNDIVINDYRIIYNGIDENNFKTIEKGHIPNEVFTILYVGGSKLVKGYDLLVDTVEELLKSEHADKLKVTVLGSLSSDCEFIRSVKNDLWVIFSK